MLISFHCIDPFISNGTPAVWQFPLTFMSHSSSSNSSLHPLPFSSVQHLSFSERSRFWQFCIHTVNNLNKSLWSLTFIHALLLCNSLTSADSAFTWTSWLSSFFSPDSMSTSISVSTSVSLPLVSFWFSAAWGFPSRKITSWLYTHTHTHTQPFYSPFSGTTQVSRCQKRTSGLYAARGD